jgi:large subunit ribosomal protein L23
MKSAYDMLKDIVLTERTTALAAENQQYTFKVDPKVNKLEIRKAIEEAFSVKVAKVNTLNVKGKMRTRGRSRGRTSGWKKAVVVLESGYTIDFGA